MRTTWDVKDPRKLRSVFQTLAEFCNQSYFRRWVGAEAMRRFNAGGTEQTASVTTDFSGLSLAQSTTDDLVFSMPRPEMWIDGDLFVTLYYTGSGSANNAAVDVSLRTWALAGAVSSRSTESQTTLTPPNSQLQSATFGPWNLTAAADMFALAIERASDSHAAALELLGLYLDFKPRRY